MRAIPSISAHKKPQEVLRMHGRSFHFAQLFLARETAAAAARLYAFCRYVDDIADEASDQASARRVLEEIAEDFKTKTRSCRRVADMLDLCASVGIDDRIVDDLLSGVLSDTFTVRVESERELLEYCYKVAGTVGIMMSPLLGCRGANALPHAAALGIAMQLTNIARDVAEDADAGRIYLPSDWIGDFDPSQIKSGGNRRIKEAVARILLLAEQFYQSGEVGLNHLPRRSRLAILIAARTYRAIGTEIAKRDFALEPRAVVPFWKKLVISAGCIARFALKPGSLLSTSLPTLEHKCG